MTKRYLGNIITQNPTAPAGDFAISAAKGVWSLEEQLAYQKAGLWPVAGNFPLNVEDVFSTYLYEGNGGTNTITNGIDLAGEGGLVWLKDRSAANGHRLYDSERDSVNPSSFAKPALQTNGNNANLNYQDGVTTFNSNGFVIKDLSGAGGTQGNTNGNDITSWTFRKAPKFFDIVTYTGNSTAGRTISHNLGSVPAMIIVKSTDIGYNWAVYHKGLNGGTNPEDYYILLNSTAAEVDNSAGSIFWGAAPTSTGFTVGGAPTTNRTGYNYVAYLFAHNDGDGEFGPDADADIIKCGSWTASQPSTVTLGFEPQWLLVKRTDGTGSWFLVDNMRGADFTAYKNLSPDLSNAEGTQAGETFTFNPDGFTYNGSVLGGGNTCIYIAIRRPTAVPTSATDVFDVLTSSSSSALLTSNTVTTDALLHSKRTTNAAFRMHSRLTGQNGLTTYSTAAEGDYSTYLQTDEQTGFELTGFWGTNPAVYYSWKRTPSFFDVVAYTGTGVAGRTVSHNLGVAPEMMWVKSRSNAQNLYVYHKDVGAGSYLTLQTNNAAQADTYNWIWNSTAPTSTEFTVSTFSGQTNYTYIAYLFASLAGVSKVGSATHSGTTNVDCGFTSGARFVLLKRTDASGDWYIWDSTRGIVSGNDPYLLLNSTAAEVTNTDYIDPLSSGFTITSNFTAGDYIFYAIA